MAVAVCVAPVFAEEYSTGMDVLQRSSRKGRGKLVAAKLITGFSFTLLLGAVTFVISLAMEICIYGSGSLDAPIQMMESLLLSSYPFTVGEMLLLLFFASEISLLVLAAVVMFCFARMNSSFGPVLVGGTKFIVSGKRNDSFLDDNPAENCFYAAGTFCKLRKFI